MSDSIVQSVIFSVLNFNVQDSTKWLKKHGFKYNKLDITDNFFRYRQENPEKLKKKGYTTIRTKDLNNGVELIIFYKDTLNEGGAVAVKNIKSFIDESYNKKAKDKIDDYELDKSISNDYAKVYYNPKTRHCVVVHRGTQGASDWLNNVAYVVGAYKLTNRYKTGKEIQQKAEKKYGKSNVSTLGHSQGAMIASEVGKKSKEIIKLNPAYKGEKEGKNEYTIRSKSDVVSGVKHFKPSDQTITIKAETYNPLKEHSSDILNRLDQEQMIGSGIETKEESIEETTEEIEERIKLKIEFTKTIITRMKNETAGQRKLSVKSWQDKWDEILKMCKEINNKSGYCSFVVFPEAKKQQKQINTLPKPQDEPPRPPKEPVNKESDNKDKFIIPKAPENLPSDKIIKNNAEELIQGLEEVGRTKQKIGVDYKALNLYQIITYLQIMIKYNKRCAIIDKKELDGFLITDKINSPLNTRLYNKAEEIAKDILECIKRGEEVLFIPLSIFFNGEGHFNLLVYKPLKGTLERFEPHGAHFNGDKKTSININKVLKKLFFEKMKPILGKYTPTIYLDAEANTPKNTEGFQSLECLIDDFDHEGGGFCGMWGCFTAELQALNPEYSMLQVVEEANKITKNDPQRLKDIIRGYVVRSEEFINEYLKNAGVETKFKYSELFDEAKIMSKYFYKIQEHFLNLSMGWNTGDKKDLEKNNSTVNYMTKKSLPDTADLDKEIQRLNKLKIKELKKPKKSLPDTADLDKELERLKTISDKIKEDNITKYTKPKKEAPKKEMTREEEFIYYKNLVATFTPEERSRLRQEKRNATERLFEIKRLKSKKAELEREELNKIILDPLRVLSEIQISDEAEQRGDDARDKRMESRKFENQSKAQKQQEAYNRKGDTTTKYLLEHLENVKKMAKYHYKETRLNALQEINRFIKDIGDDYYKDKELLNGDKMEQLKILTKQIEKEIENLPSHRGPEPDEFYNLDERTKNGLIIREMKKDEGIEDDEEDRPHYIKHFIDTILNKLDKMNDVELKKAYNLVIAYFNKLDRITDGNIDSGTYTLQKKAVDRFCRLKLFNDGDIKGTKCDTEEDIKERERINKINLTTQSLSYILKEKDVDYKELQSKYNKVFDPTGKNHLIFNKSWKLKKTVEFITNEIENEKINVERFYYLLHTDEDSYNKKYGATPTPPPTPPPTPTPTPPPTPPPALKRPTRPAPAIPKEKKLTAKEIKDNNTADSHIKTATDILSRAKQNGHTYSSKVKEDVIKAIREHVEKAGELYCPEHDDKFKEAQRLIEEEILNLPDDTGEDKMGDLGEKQKQIIKLLNTALIMAKKMEDLEENERTEQYNKIVEIFKQASNLDSNFLKTQQLKMNTIKKTILTLREPPSKRDVFY